jgi:ribosomal protein S18 acetylase RimI-like enzyme
VRIDAATEQDLDAIDEIEQHSFKSPWTRATFEGELQREWARIDVMRDGDRIVAFCNYWLVTPRAAPQRDQDDKRADGELHILAIATHPD